MKTVTLEEAQSHLAELVAQAAPGEEVVITRGGDPVAKLIATPRWPRGLGFMHDGPPIPDNFDTMFQKEIEEMFYGED